MKFKGKGCVIHMPQCLAGIDDCVDNSCKQRAEYLCRSLVIIYTEHDQWQASFIWEKCLVKVSSDGEVMPCHFGTMQRLWHLSNICKRLKSMLCHIPFAHPALSSAFVSLGPCPYIHTKLTLRVCIPSLNTNLLVVVYCRNGSEEAMYTAPSWSTSQLVGSLIGYPYQY